MSWQKVTPSFATRAQHHHGTYAHYHSLSSSLALSGDTFSVCKVVNSWWIGGTNITISISTMEDIVKKQPRKWYGGIKLSIKKRLPNPPQNP